MRYAVARDEVRRGIRLKIAWQEIKKVPGQRRRLGSRIQVLDYPILIRPVEYVLYRGCGIVDVKLGNLRVTGTVKFISFRIADRVWCCIDEF